MGVETNARRPWLALALVLAAILTYLLVHPLRVNQDVALNVQAGQLLCERIPLASRWSPRVRNAAYPGYVHDGIRVGKWMRSRLPPGSLLATNTAGTIAYYSELPIIDMMGINDRVIATRKELPDSWKGIKKGDGTYVLARKPDYILLGSSTGSLEPVFLSDVEIYMSEDFWRNYELSEVEVDAWTHLFLYERRQRPQGTGPSAEEWIEIRDVADQRISQSAFRY